MRKALPEILSPAKSGGREGFSEFFFRPAGVGINVDEGRQEIGDRDGARGGFEAVG